MTRAILGVGALAAASVIAVQPAKAELTITAAGAALGFSLSTVVSGFPFNGLGPIGITVLPNGNILANSVADSSNYVFANVDNQTFADHIGAGIPNIFCCSAMATANGWAWGGNGGHLVRFNNDGSIAQNFNSISQFNGLWTNPVNGHLLGAAGSLYDIDVSDVNAPIATLIPGTAQDDGLVVSPDGTIVYTSGIRGYRISDGAQVFNHPISGGDGMGIIYSDDPTLNGLMVANTTVGDLWLVDPTGTNADVLIADFGARGDYTTPDPNGTLLLTQGATIMRLSCGEGCSVGVDVEEPTVPEPASMALLGVGVLGLGAWRGRRRR